MSHLSKKEMERRSIVIRDRLEETRFIRSTMKMSPDTVEVGLAIAYGLYTSEPVNVASVARRILMDKATVMRHAKKLAALPEPLVTITRRGQDTIMRLTDEATEHELTRAYFTYRYASLVENGLILGNLLKI